MFWNNQLDAFQSSLYLFYCQVTLQVSSVSRTHHQNYINCSYNHWHKSCCKLQRYRVEENYSLKELVCRYYCASGFNYSLCT
jgi:hypothetical protein